MAVANPRGLAIAIVPARRYSVPIIGSSIPPLRTLVVSIFKFIAEKPPIPMNRIIKVKARGSMAAGNP